MSLILLGRRSLPDCKSEYLPFHIKNAPLPVSGVRLQGAIRVLLYKSLGGLCRETKVSHFIMLKVKILENRVLMKKTFLLFLALTVLAAKQREVHMRDSVVLESVTVTGKSKTQRLREGALSVNAIDVVTNRKRKNYLDVSYGLGSYHTHKADISGQYLLKNGLTLRPTLAVNYSKNDYVMKDVEVWDESARKYLPQDRRRFHDDYFSLFGQLEVGVTNKSWADEFFVYLSYNKVSKDLQTGQVQTRVIGMADRTSSAVPVSRFLIRGITP